VALLLFRRGAIFSEDRCWVGVGTGTTSMGAGLSAALCLSLARRRARSSSSSSSSPSSVTSVAPSTSTVGGSCGTKSRLMTLPTAKRRVLQHTHRNERSRPCSGGMTCKSKGNAVGHAEADWGETQAAVLNPLLFLCVNDMT
jgi:hypothetical protein